MKRWTDTDKWDKKWFRKLTPPQKLLWLFLCDTCNDVGVVEFDGEHAAHFIGCPITDADLTALVKQYEQRDDGRIWIKDFIEFQQGALSTECNGQKKVFEAAQEFGIDVTPWLKKGTPPPKHPPVEKSHGESVYAADPPARTASEITALEADFNRIYEAYPKKKRREESLRVFTLTDAPQHLPQILAAIEWQQKSTDWKKDSGRYIPTLDQYLSDRAWTQNNPATFTYHGRPAPELHAPILKP